VYSKKSLSDFVFIGNSDIALAEDEYAHETNRGYDMSIIKFFEEKVLKRWEKYGTGN